MDDKNTSKYNVSNSNLDFKRPKSINFEQLANVIEKIQNIFGA